MGFDALDDLEGPRAGVGGGLGGPRPLIAGIGEDALDERERAARLPQNLVHAIAILDVGGVDDDTQEEAERVDKDVPLAPRDPNYVVRKLAEALDFRFSKALNGARALLIGVAYKKNVEDTREGPAFKLIDLLEARGVIVDYYDPFVPIMPTLREHPNFAGRRPIRWSQHALAQYGVALICTDHDEIYYAALVASCRLVIDTRNATRAVADTRGVVVRA